MVVHSPRQTLITVNSPNFLTTKLSHNTIVGFKILDIWSNFMAFTYFPQSHNSFHCVCNSFEVSVSNFCFVSATYMHNYVDHSAKAIFECKIFIHRTMFSHFEGITVSVVFYWISMDVYAVMIFV